jgi:sigma-B regulation protein RsbU (phosphoserine phosphatase)
VTRRIGRGDLAARAAPEGPTEVRALAGAMNQMAGELDASRRALAEKERLEREMEIAMKIQTSILPKRFDVAGLEIAARMIPASEVGGDYYDVLPVERGCWIGVGDVAGHGLTAGLEMLMVQSVIAALVRANPDAAPKDQLTVLNHVIFENIRDRLDQDEHITLTLMRYADGVVTFAGAHEEIVVLRAGGAACERIATPGTWLGAMRDIAAVTRDSALPLASGDLMVLYSDGVTEAPGAGGVQFGMDRLCTLIEDSRGETAEAIRDRIVAAVQAWQTRHDDDISVMVVRRAAPPA